MTHCIHAVAWHATHLLSLSLALPSMHHLVTLALHTPLIVPDTSLDDFVHQTHQAIHAPTRPDMPVHDRARTASVADVPGHVVAPPARVTSASNLCASRRTTPPCTSWTWPLARGNVTGDDCIGDRPPRCCPLPSSSPSHQTTVCCSKGSVMIAWTSPTVRAHPLPLRRPGTTTPSTTCQLRHGHLSPL